MAPANIHTLVCLAGVSTFVARKVDIGIRRTAQSRRITALACLAAFAVASPAWAACKDPNATRAFTCAEIDLLQQRAAAETKRADEAEADARLARSQRQSAEQAVRDIVADVDERVSQARREGLRDGALYTLGGLAAVAAVVVAVVLAK